ncbi:MAG: ribonuclease P protein component [bacterium]|nr:ribonuclease P protein component [bacterium]MDZ4205965.1 ribonuclease P protein component [Patescibacteria group bacterium]
MLPKNRRIPRKLFISLLESGKHFNSKHFSLRVTSSDKVRVAVSVSKKISKKAVVRNKVRRRAYSAVRSLIPNLTNNLFLLVAKPGAEKIKGKELENELKSLVISRRPLRL